VNTRTAPNPVVRTLVVDDIENLCGGPDVTIEAIRDVVAIVHDAFNLRPHDHVIIGTNPALGLTAAAAIPGARLVVGRGPDGADRALLAAVDPAHVARRYQRLVIGSGDHAFVPLAREARRRGVAVTVVARQGAISWRLVQVADQVVTFVLPDHFRSRA
jgi:hypothetical protein